MSTERLRVVIAEDNYLVREGTRRLLEDSGAIEVLNAVGDGEVLCDAVRRLGPDAVLTDIRMPPGHHMEGIEAAHKIRAAHPGVGVAVLSQHTEPAYAYALLSGGATGVAYLLKDRLWDVEELVRALREVANGGSVIDRRAGGPPDPQRPVPAGRAQPARARRAARDGAGPHQRGHRAGVAPVRVDGREARQRDLLEARARGGADPPQGRGRAGLPARPRLASE